MTKTYVTKPDEIQRRWFVIDADGRVLGRMACEIAGVLRGKGKPHFSPHLDVGDHVVVVNAGKVRMTGNKLDQKTYYRHSGYPGGLKTETARTALEKRPERVVKAAVKGMLPKGPLGNKMLKKLKVYAGPEHPHEAQKPDPWPA